MHKEGPHPFGPAQAAFPVNKTHTYLHSKQPEWPTFPVDPIYIYMDLIQVT